MSFTPNPHVILFLYVSDIFPWPFPFLLFVTPHVLVMTLALFCFYLAIPIALFPLFLRLMFLAFQSLPVLLVCRLSLASIRRLVLGLFCTTSINRMDEEYGNVLNRNKPLLQ